MVSPLWLVAAPRSLYKEDYLHIKNVCPFDYPAFAVRVRVGILYTGATTPVE